MLKVYILTKIVASQYMLFSTLSFYQSTAHEVLLVHCHFCQAALPHNWCPERAVPFSIVWPVWQGGVSQSCQAKGNEVHD